MALRKMNIESLFPVQVAVWQETIGPGAFERDICVNSPTGSGKTLSYALPIVQALASRKIRCLRALVVLPTRDLALQVGLGLFGSSFGGRISLTVHIFILLKKRIVIFSFEIGNCFYLFSLLVIPFLVFC